MALLKEHEWKQLIADLKNNLRAICTNPEDTTSFVSMYNNLFAVTFNLCVNQTKNIPIISKKDKLLLKQSVNEGTTCTSENQLAVDLSEVLTLIQNIDADAYSVLVKFLY